MASNSEVITKKSLEEILKRKIELFKVKSGANDGDNYSSTMFSIEVHFKKDEKCEEVQHIIAKCYPANPLRQKTLIEMNLFWKEVNIFNTWIPALMKLQEDLGVETILKPAFPPFVAGHAKDFGHNAKIEENKNTILYKPFDNYVMMIDLRTRGFTMADRFSSLDKNHAILYMEEIAKIHALGWAYKQKYNITKITSKFPFISTDFTCNAMRVFLTQLTTTNGQLAIETLQSHLGENSPLVTGTKNFLSKSGEIGDIVYNYQGTKDSDSDLEKYLRIKPEAKEEIPWRLVIHGDCWTNNLLFRYNESTKIPEEIILVDLQMGREACPTIDLVNFIYTSTDSEFRKKHLDEMLELYAIKFIHFCKKLKTEPLHNFSLPELKRRFHRAKLHGYYIALLAMPLILLDSTKVVNMDNIKGKETSEMMQSASLGAKDDHLFLQRILGLAQDLYDEGVI